MIDAKYSDGQYTGFETSEEVIQAIENLTESDLLEHVSLARELWENGYTDDVSNVDVITLAWSYADEEKTELIWGGVIRRTV